MNDQKLESHIWTEEELQTLREHDAPFHAKYLELVERQRVHYEQFKREFPDKP